MEQLKFIGRGSAFNVAELNNSAYIKKNGVMLLFDCGESIAREIIKRNLLEDVKELYILITHFHPDHAGSLGTLIFHCKYNLNIIPTVHYPDFKALKMFLMYQGLINIEDYTYIDFQCRIPKSIKDKLSIDLITSATADHDEISKIEKLMSNNICIEGHKEIVFSAFSYYIRFKNLKKIYYSGDNCNLPEHVISTFDVIYQDTTLADYSGNIHLSLRELCEKVPEELRYKVYCMHINCEELVQAAKEKGFNVVECID